MLTRRRRYNNSTNKPPTSPQTSDRANRVLARLPRSMQRYTTALRNAPVSHVAAFLVLHELTAIVPLFALFGLFHYTDYVPLDYMLGHYGGYVRDGMARFERYFRRKGWFGFDEQEEGRQLGKGEEGEEQETVMDRWESPDGKYKIVVEVALAYAITKALLPVRIVGSLWATPWFAGLFARIRGVASRK
ncbi:hypothetical protein M406DRAFT_247296 [Cryphonectria parasitica EP155]|uniref:Mitochondrial seryl-tRNA synthetase n=1 Tax=Cryphonectria parasitica (strain ATCC 38755 / EP155) TaxID=660469 RepID=A0A9P5CU40_CRYP1|nr:uncharacterized protein M406DRAFT_247296 [Cryphonectria parasitica EP155]KAF3771289.1 hypothetical protein M406DRAFT_247296 [Cryphonectria parasitica EP155]